MISIFNNSSRIEVDTLFFQPTKYCTYTCPGCYVKEHIGLYNQTDNVKQVEIIKTILDGKYIYTNQFTVSMDILPEDKHKRQHMLSILEAITQSNKSIPEIHLTFRDEDSFKNYIIETNTNETNLFNNINVLTLSDIKNTSFVREELLDYIHINYNHLCPEDGLKNINFYIDKIIQISKVVDSIYVILFKSLTGKLRTILEEENNRFRMKSDILYVKEILKRLPPDARSKINIDSCLKDIVRNKRTSFGCSANISKFHIWYDGTVSGCPYSISSSGNPGRSVRNILENIRESKKQYDFERCNFLQDYQYITRR